MAQAEMHATAKNANLELLENQLTTIALPRTAESHAGACSERVSSKQDYNAMCILCMEDARSVVLMPCKHLCMYNECTDKRNAQREHQKAMCPVCRNPIIDTIETFV